MLCGIATTNDSKCPTGKLAAIEPQNFTWTYWHACRFTKSSTQLLSLHKSLFTQLILVEIQPYNVPISTMIALQKDTRHFSCIAKARLLITGVVKFVLMITKLSSIVRDCFLGGCGVIDLYYLSNLSAKLNKRVFFTYKLNNNYVTRI